MSKHDNDPWIKNDAQYASHNDYVERQERRGQEQIVSRLTGLGEGSVIRCKSCGRELIAFLVIRNNGVHACEINYPRYCMYCGQRWR